MARFNPVRSCAALNEPTHQQRARLALDMPIVPGVEVPDFCEDAGSTRRNAVTESERAPASNHRPGTPPTMSRDDSVSRVAGRAQIVRLWRLRFTNCSVAAQ